MNWLSPGSSCLLTDVVTRVLVLLLQVWTVFLPILDSGLAEGSVAPGFGLGLRVKGVALVGHAGFGMFDFSFAFRVSGLSCSGLGFRV